ncbi:MAG: putative phage protein Gp19 [Bradyrhizobium sp.]|nr:putative phage protein Gp19 [Bradyrhizobium sp.]
MSPVLTEDLRRTAHYLVSEANGYRSREQIVIASGAGVLKPGMVLGKTSFGAASPAAKSGGNTGNGTITMDVSTPILAGAKTGVYTVRCITAASNGGTFRVEDPDGAVLGDVAVAATFADDIKFVIADGATDFIVGDGFDISIAAGSGKYVPYSPAGLDGRQNACAILFEGCDATSADVRRVVTARSSEVEAAALQWGAGVTTDNHKNTALAALAALGIAAR